MGRGSRRPHHLCPRLLAPKMGKRGYFMGDVCAHWDNALEVRDQGLSQFSVPALDSVPYSPAGAGTWGNSRRAQRATDLGHFSKGAPSAWGGAGRSPTSRSLQGLQLARLAGPHQRTGQLPDQRGQEGGTNIHHRPGGAVTVMCGGQRSRGRAVGSPWRQAGSQPALPFYLRLCSPQQIGPFALKEIITLRGGEGWP